MTLPTIEKINLGPLVVPRVWNGLWQLSSPSWGTAPTGRIRREMARHVDQGYYAFDMADHYGSAEQLFGQFRQSLASPSEVVGATKWCIFRPTVVTRAVVEDAIKERNLRMRTDHVDLLQIHWQDYSDKSYLDAILHLRDLRDEGIITAIGLVNFDAIRTDEICTEMGPGVIVSNQVAFSLIDTRPLDGMADVCLKHDVKLLTYGSLCGGFLGDKWLGEPEPDAYTETMTPSQRKYLDVILTAWGGWALFQALLSVLRTIGDQHGGLSIANIATRWVLDHPFVGAVIIGARLGVSEHTKDNHHVFGFHLSKEDNDLIESVLERSNGRKLIHTIGDCGAEYR